MRVGNLFPCLRGSDLQKDAQPVDKKLPLVSIIEDAAGITSEKPAIKELEIQENQQTCPERGGLWLQFAAAISASFAVMACGGYLGWTSPALPHLQGPNSEFPVTVYQGSWIASLYTLGGIIGSLLSPLLINRLGRKFSLLAFAIPQLAGWGLIIAARSYVILYVARFVAGIAHGGIYNVAVIYFAEIADKDIRGAFGTLLKMCTNLGGLFVTTAGAYLPYDKLNLVSLLLPLVFVSTFIFMPESPYFFLIQNREDRATRSLMQLRRLKRPESVKKDIDAMRDAYSLEADVSMITWLPIAALIVYEIMVALGIGTIPYVILGEIFPTNVKGPAVAAGIIIGSIFAFVVGLGFQALNKVAGIHSTFWFFSGCCAAGTLWVYIITPETKGKTLEEIQAIFNPPRERQARSQDGVA
ncbi:hypothetical protein TSAR_016591 [Trichomalopsis sarcophagae]|uniref:Major facilitator superfamily (MFS) profile domain-containing protein n=1 Tax=Trichomalopsis sarcophagae TaxID=543379 RepID=A0A232F2K1_9HYME|nr:hypothetical protein TSAR_016591 [Trichomalopsis sarcophagae]